MKISRKLKMTEIVGLVLVCTLIFLLFFPVYPQRGVSKRSWCYSNLKQLAFAYLMYAEDGDGYAPPYVPQPQLVRAADAVEFVQVPAQPDAWMNCLQEFVRSDGIYRCPLDPHFGKPDQLEGRYGACTHERTSYAAARLRSEEVRPDGTVRIPLPGDESAVLLTDSVLINREAEAAPYATSHGQEVIQAYRDGHVKIGSLGRP